jgi:hypothetical protein
MRTRSSTALGAGFGLIVAVVTAFTIRAIYQEGNLLSSALALVLPLVALLFLHEGTIKRVVSTLIGLATGCALTLLWLTFADDLNSFALFAIALCTLIVPIAVDVVLLDTGARIPVSPAVARNAAVVFAAVVFPLASVLLSYEHREIMRKDQDLIREFARHVELYENWIVFDRVDPRRETRLKNCLAVRAMGKTYRLSNAHFEKVSEEYTVKKRTSRRGVRKRVEISREREERLRVVVDLGKVERPENIVVFSMRGPLTIAEEEVALPGSESADDPPVS